MASLADTSSNSQGNSSVWTLEPWPAFPGESVTLSPGNYRRAYAAVNACAGIPQDMLEQMAGSPGVLHWLAGLPVAVREQAGEFLRLLIEACPEMAVNGVSAFHDHYAFAPSLVLLLARAMPGAARTHGPPVVEATEMLTRLIDQRDALLREAKEAKSVLSRVGGDLPNEAYRILADAIERAESG